MSRDWFLETNLIEKYLDKVLGPRLIPNTRYPMGTAIAAYEAKRASQASVELNTEMMLNGGKEKVN